jgi:predicted kinase
MMQSFGLGPAERFEQKVSGLREAAWRERLHALEELGAAEAGSVTGAEEAGKLGARIFARMFETVSAQRPALPAPDVAAAFCDAARALERIEAAAPGCMRDSLAYGRGMMWKFAAAEVARGNSATSFVDLTEKARAALEQVHGGELLHHARVALGGLQGMVEGERERRERAHAAGLAIDIPQGALVVLAGVSGSGKSTFAKRNFEASAIVSTDALREVISGNPHDQTVSAEAFDLAQRIVELRLGRGRTTVVDATSTSPAERRLWLGVAQAMGRPAVAIVIDTDLDECLSSNAGRPRPVPEHVVRDQHAALRAGLPAIGSEGFAAIHHLSSRADVTYVPVTVTLQEAQGPSL